MKKVIITILGIAIIGSCAKPLIFPDSGSPLPPQLKQASAKLLWIGPDYRVALAATIEDADGIASVQAKNGEWQIDTVYSTDGHTTYVVVDTIDVWKDANPTKHTIEFWVTNKKGGVVKGNVDVEDLSGQNQVPGYDPDELPPVITVTKPTVLKYYGLTNDAITLDIDATITDESIASVEIKVWGETIDGQPVSQEELITPADPAEKLNYHYTKSFTLPGGKAGEYQYVIRSTDASGNKSVKGNNITVGIMDRLYLSDAKDQSEVANQAYESGGACRGIGTLLSMKKQGTNIFTTDFYYRNEPTDVIRFVTFLGTDRPFSANQANVLYTFDGPNVVAMSASQSGKIVTDLSQAGSKLPVNQKGYYRVTVNMNDRTVRVEPFTPAKPVVNPTLYPGWSSASPWTYLAVTGPPVTNGGGGYTETANSPKLNKEAGHDLLYSGTFRTSGVNSANISINAPLAFVNDNYYGKGWFRLTAARANMRDDYNDLISKIGAVGASGNGANYGFTVSNAGRPTGTFVATYDIGLERLRIVRTGD
jgi:hypothetical protein